jgi:uridine kinase
MTSDSGSRNYTRSLFFVLCKAVHDLYPQSKVVIDIPVSKGYYVDLTIGHEVTDDDVKRIRQRMQQIIDAKMPIRRFEVPTEDAVKMFEEKGDKAKSKLLRSAGSLYTTYYQIDDYVDYYYGSLLTNTSKIYLFGLEKYFNGLLLRIPDLKDPGALPQMTRQDKMFEIFKEHHRWQEIMGLRTVGDFNEMVRKGQPTNLINVSEALQEKKLTEIADEIASAQGRETRAPRRSVFLRKDHHLQATEHTTAGQRHQTAADLARRLLRRPRAHAQGRQGRI